MATRFENATWLQENLHTEQADLVSLVEDSLALRALEFHFLRAQAMNQT